MADGIDISITGVESLVGKLSSISDDLRRRGGRAALRRAGNVIVEKAKANAARIDDPLTGRSIAANVAMRWNNRIFKTTGNLGFRIGVLHGAVLKKHPDLGENAPTPHWRLIEFGIPLLT
ncbi:HK97 gp10 family phage protein [Escherichia coli]|nr:HK97 gp10 family phage protein [Escherichia coli]HDW0472736.1 HK97 gp10 family phage protein [Escherichia coli]